MIMKIILLELFSIIFFSCTINNVTQAEKKTTQNSFNKIDTLKIIKEIDNKISEINKNKESYQKVKKDIYAETLEKENIYRHGATVIEGYYLNKQLLKIKVIFEGDRETVILEYYFDNNNLIFSIREYESYYPPKWDANSKLSSLEENNFYFNNQNLITWLGKGSKNISSSEFYQKQKAIIKDVQDYIKYLEEKNIKILEEKK